MVLWADQCTRWRAVHQALTECLDQLTWNLDNRAALFQSPAARSGVQLAVTTSRVDLLISMASF